MHAHGCLFFCHPGSFGKQSAAYKRLCRWACQGEASGEELTVLMGTRNLQQAQVVGNAGERGQLTMAVCGGCLQGTRTHLQ